MKEKTQYQIDRDNHVINEARKHGVNPDMMFAIRDLGENSGPKAISPAGAKGRWQFMDATARQYGVNQFDEDSSATGAVKFMKDILTKYRKEFPGRSEREYEAAAVAYYNGGGKAGNAVMNGKPPPAKETQNYMKKTKYDDVYKNQKTSFSNKGSGLDSFLSNYDAYEKKGNKQPTSSNTTKPRPNLGNGLDAFLANYAEYEKKGSQSSGVTPSTTTPTLQQQPQQPPVVRKGIFGEDVGDMAADQASGDSGVESPASRVFKDSGVSALTAGLVQPGFATQEERVKNPGASAAGSILGVIPWTMATGGMGAVGSSAVLGARGAAQTYNEGGTAGESLLVGGVEGGVPLLGRAAAAGLGKSVEKVASSLLPKGKTLTDAALTTKANRPFLKKVAKDTVKDSGMAAAKQAVKGEFQGATTTILKSTLINVLKNLPELSPKMARNIAAALPGNKITRADFARAYSIEKQGAGKTIFDLVNRRKNPNKRTLINEGEELYDRIQANKETLLKLPNLLTGLPEGQLDREMNARDRYRNKLLGQQQ